MTTKKEKTNTTITLNRALTIFPDYLDREGKSKSTITAYESDLSLVREFYKIKLKGRDKDVTKISLAEVEQFKDFLHEKVKCGELKTSTVARKFNAFKTFFKFLEKCYGVPNIVHGDKWGNKSTTIRSSKDTEINLLSMDEIGKILDTISSSYDNNKYRDYAIFRVLIGTGCRRSELLNLSWGDISFNRNEIKIYREKTKNISVLKVSDEIMGALRKVFKTQGKLLFGEYVFTSRQSGSLSASAFTATIDKWVEASGIKKDFKVTAHTFRHTFVTECLRNNINDSHIIHYTGHASVDSLEPYKHLVPRDMDAIASVMCI